MSRLPTASLTHAPAGRLTTCGAAVGLTHAADLARERQPPLRM